MPSAPWRFDSLAPSGPWISGTCANTGTLPAHGLVDLHLAGGVGEVVDAADDVRDAHVVVVDHDGEIVGRGAVAAQDDHVVQLSVRHHDAALHSVVDHRLALAGRPQAQDGLDRRPGPTTDRDRARGSEWFAGPSAAVSPAAQASRSAAIAACMPSSSAGVR